MANFPYQSNDAGALLQTQAILGGVATSASDGSGAVRVSAIFAGSQTTSQSDASQLRVSAFESVVTTNTGGSSLYFTSSGTTSQVSTVKSTAGRLYGYHVGNPAGVDQYLQIFNASGGATAGTDTPTLSLYVPTLGGAVMSLGAGIGFSSGIQVIGTSTVNGQTIGASALRINVFYA